MRYNSRMPRQYTRIDPLRRFLSRITIQYGCWQLGKSVKTYPTVWANGENMSAHRLSFEFFNGPIPKGMMVCHRCDNRSCVNPAHLFLGYSSDNIQDMYAKGRGVDNRGERCGTAKLTGANVDDIRRRHRAGERAVALAVEYGVCESQVYYILRGECWKERNSNVKLAH